MRVGEAASGNGDPARGLQAATARRGEGVHGVWDGCWVSGGWRRAGARCSFIIEEGIEPNPVGRLGLC